MNITLRLTALVLALLIFVYCFSGCAPQNARVNINWLDLEEMPEPEEVTDIMLFQNGVQVYDNEYSDNSDIKKIYVTQNKSVIYDYANGYKLDLPKDVNPDYSLAKYVCRYESDDITAVISVESGSDYSTVDSYYQSTFTRNYSNESFMTNNGFTFEETVCAGSSENGLVYDLFRGEKSDMSDEYKAKYSYIYFRSENGSKTYYRVLLKYRSDYAFEALEQLVIDSFSLFDASGIKVNNDDYKYPAIPQYWNEETKKYYQYFCNSDTTQWGLYFYQNYAGLERENFFEKQVEGSRFDLVLYYISMPNLEFDVNFANKVYEQDKVPIVTVRYEDATGRDICYPFDIVAGKYDDQFAAFADDVAEYGHPVIIRMENEFNTDWSSCSGLRSLGDPDWYRDAWIHIYNIFLERGVDNAIFMSNPESEQTSYPVQNWLHYIHYLPPKEYIQIIGLTAYNFGQNSYTNYSFSHIYAGVNANNVEFFSKWPWLIGEFGCAGPNEGVDKAAWIQEMFNTIDLYPNIKGAIWFDSTDLNADGSVLRDFRLSSPLDAGITFAQCIKNTKAKSITGEWHYEREE